MDFKWSDRQNELRKQFETFAKQHVFPNAHKHSQNNTFDFESWNSLTKTNLWKNITPKEHGGAEGNWWDFTAALEGLASGASDGGFVLTVISQAGFIRGLSLFGTEEQKKRIFPNLLNGALTATAIAESHTGTSTASIKTTAISDGNGAYILNGDKYNIAHANTGKYTLVVGRMPELGKRDITLFMIENDRKGFNTGPSQEKMGNRTIPTTWIEFDNVKVTDDDILGEKGNGIKTLVSTISLGRLYYGLVSAHLIKPAFEKVWNFISERSSFGQNLMDHQYVQGKITDIIIRCEQAKWTSYGALWQLLNNNKEAFRTSSVAKLTGVNGLEKSCQDLMTLMGSRGYLDNNLSRLMKDALGFLWVGGTEEMHRINIFKQTERLLKK